MPDAQGEVAHYNEEEKVMNQREYESGLKKLLEVVSTELNEHDPWYLEHLYMPSNVPGVKPITVSEWLDARWTKRNYPAGPQ